MVTGQSRYGIGEWYGASFVQLTHEERLGFAQYQMRPDSAGQPQPCPFKPGTCTKKGGVCSIRLYQRTPDGVVAVAPDQAGMLRATCPYRFHEAGIVVSTIGKTLLGHEQPLVVKEVGFLAPLPTIGDSAHAAERSTSMEREIGRIDMVLVHPDTEPSLRWCAVEMQAVYFSGKAMSNEFRAIAHGRPETACLSRSRIIALTTAAAAPSGFFPNCKSR